MLNDRPGVAPEVGAGRPGTGISLASRRRRRGRGGARLWPWLLAAAALVVAYPTVVRPWHLRWGATDEEVRAALSGDEYVPSPVYTATRAITIEAPAEAVWPWLAQMGQGRGGLYSYDWLENLFGCDIHSVDRIVPELQSPAVGDEFRLYREGGGPPPLTIAMVEPGRALVLRGGEHYSWAFVLVKVDDHTTRLIARTRSYSDPAWVAPLAGVEPIHFVMERKMLYGIKERVERGASS